MSCEIKKTYWEPARRFAIEMLKAMDLDAYEDSHERLSAICMTVLNPKFGWTLGACEELRERLIYLLGGYGDDADASDHTGYGVFGTTCGVDCGERHQQPTEAVDPDVMSLSVRTFELGTPKDVALKVLEEAAEAFAAWQEVDAWGDSPEQCNNCTTGCLSRIKFTDELADVVQAACNLAARYGIDMGAAMRRCEQRQRERGRL